MYSSYTCFSCGIESPCADSQLSADILAYENGWSIGLDRDGQANFACPDCSPSLFDALPASPIWTYTFRKIGRRRYAVVRSDNKIVGEVFKFGMLKEWYAKRESSTLLLSGKTRSKAASRICFD